MERGEFHNLLRVLKSLDQHEVGLDDKRWIKFRDDPVWFFICADDETAEAIWAAIQRRTTR